MCPQALGMGTYAHQAWHQATATTGRKVVLAAAALCIANELYRYVSIAIQRSLLTLRDVASYNTPQQPHQDPQKPWVTLFCHGLKATGEQGNEYKKQLSIPHGFETFDFPYASTDLKSFAGLTAMSNCSLGQTHDINQLRTKITVHADTNIIMHGISAGAATALTTVAFDRPAQVRALILESPFDDVKSVVAGIASYASFIPGVTTLGNIAASLIFPHYSTGNLRPIDLVIDIPDHVPVLFICSDKDRLVPAWSTKRLYTALKEYRTHRGIDNVYLVEMQQGKHGQLLQENQKEYQHAVHAFYKKVGLSQSIA